MVRVKRNAIEGIKSALLPDTSKKACDYCGGTSFMINKLICDDPADIAGATAFAALDITKGAGSDPIGQILLCDQCGHEQLGQVIIFDVCTFTGAETTPALTDLDCGIINNLAGWWFVCLVGDDLGKYVSIASNSVADPTVLTLAFAVADNADGICFVTNIEPVGLTKISA